MALASMFHRRIKSNAVVEAYLIVMVVTVWLAAALADYYGSASLTIASSSPQPLSNAGGTQLIPIRTCRIERILLLKVMVHTPGESAEAAQPNFLELE